MPEKRVNHFSFLVDIFFKVVWSLGFCPTVLCLKRQKTNQKNREQKSFRKNDREGQCGHTEVMKKRLIWR